LADPIQSEHQNWHRPKGNTSMNHPDKLQTLTSKASIGLPVYNGGKFIRETLDSLLAQTFTDFELIISDNASTDDTEAICREYSAKDKRIRYVRQSENLGQLLNFEFVLDQAVGEYFMWASADDLFSSNWLLDLASSLQGTIGYASFGAACYIDETAFTRNSTANFVYFRFNEYKSLRRIKFIFTPHLTGKMILLHSLFPTKSLRSICVGDIEVTGANSQDLHFIFLALKSIKFIPTQNCFLYKRFHAESDSKTAAKGIKRKGTKLNSDKEEFKDTFLKKIWNILFPATELSKFFIKLGANEVVHVAITFPIFLLYHAIYGSCLMLRKKVRDFS